MFRVKGVGRTKLSPEATNCTADVLFSYLHLMLQAKQNTEEKRLGNKHATV
jgi:hypothetical protein